MSYSIPVTLTSVKNPTEKRHLTLTSGTPTLVGRASRSESKNLQASPSNALFDCPVISREHAELKLSPWGPVGDRITITDKGSMHGTYVNNRKLDGRKPMSLRSGDLLQFGTRVTRGQDTHDGVVVAFDHVLPDTQSPHMSSVVPLPVNHGHYELLYSSDEGSDVSSDDEDSAFGPISDGEEENGPSSAKTTPEQTKLQPGSVERPIDLENMPPPVSSARRGPTISLIEDDDDEDMTSIMVHNGSGLYRPQSPTFGAPVKQIFDMIQDSIDRNDDILVANSVHHARNRSTVEDEESVLDHNTGLTGLLNDGAKAFSEHDDEYAEGFDYDDEDMNSLRGHDDADRLSDSDASDLDSTRGVLGVEYETGKSEAKEQGSPALGSANAAAQATLLASAPPHANHSAAGTRISHPLPPKPATQPYYDPVRASQPPTAPAYSHWAPPRLYNATAPQTSRSPYTYAPPPIPGPSGASLNLPTDPSNSSRWDIPPSNCMPPHLPIAQSTPDTYTGTGPVYPPQISSTSTRPHPHVALPWSKGANQHWDAYLPAENYSSGPAPSAGSHPPPAALFPPSRVDPVSSSANKKIAVEDLLETSTNPTQAHPDVPEVRPIKTTKKRKADEMAKDHAEPPPNPASPFQQHQPVACVTLEPPAQRRKVEERSVAKTGRKVAGGVVKYAAAATLGGAGTMAFLCSPLAERLLEWLA